MCWYLDSIPIKFSFFNSIVNITVQISGFYPTQLDNAKIASMIEDEKKIYQKIRAKVTLVLKWSTEGNSFELTLFYLRFIRMSKSY